MAFVAAGPNTKILVGDTDLSGYFSSVSLPTEVSTSDVTGFGKTHHCHIPILRDGTVSLGGFWDGSVGAVDEELAVTMASTPNVVTIGLAGLTVAERVRLVSGLKTNYEPSGEVDGVVEISAEIQAAAGGVESGISLHALAPESATSNGTSVDNGAATTNGGVAHLHITAHTGVSTLQVIVQHSTDNVTFADLATFTTASGVTSQRVEVTGTVNRYLRAYRGFVVGGEVYTFAVAFARR